MIIYMAIFPTDSDFEMFQNRVDNSTSFHQIFPRVPQNFLLIYLQQIIKLHPIIFELLIYHTIYVTSPPLPPERLSYLKTHYQFPP